MRDLIDREDALMCATGEIPEGGTYEDALKMVAKRLQMLPPVKSETCEGCQDPCIMYEPKMRACENKSEPVDVLRDEITDETFKHLLDNY